ncbi:hypothetical protein IT006_003301 [Escherichia coli]|uniref:hypothetical protein n=1 Tax=Escherichia coli TaxID=562 RepID=UPI00022436E9|nr:hypothetical protein [Escherichia coli]EKK2831191.1 hypothetical protein [Escherichia coli O33]ELW2754114.1 hypothetical protein [Escherichia coli O26]EEU5471254.1 hypothetical protein [Escherichia coli]EEV3322141.1 hypothetical protein [Escherichia coli]EEV3840897.1 hypothetical protein [Escherichia coli]
MRGKIVHVEHRIGWIAIRDDRGAITIAEIIGGYDVEKGHIISGNLHSLGSEVFHNLTTSEEMDVMVEYIGLTDNQAIAAIQRCGR